MRNAILAMTVALTLMTGQLQSSPPKSAPADVGPGRIAWFDITTTNLPQSKEFYGKALPGCRFYPGAGGPGDLHGAVGAAGIHHHDLVGKAHRFQAGANVGLLVQGDDSDGQTHNQWSVASGQWSVFAFTGN